ncbi:tail fiber protein [Vibrio aestuarianus]|uniref:tail fiber protein n=1 Tax=Vibrio aestuarianus TaxID=28171 RepID=UPI002469A96F|nr:tail fiber protein [Vibrio aestuarianus]MDH5971244.1 phage tail protein [Vibrio aestuarianus]
MDKNKRDYKKEADLRKSNPKNRNQNERLRFIDEAMSIVKAVDHRIAIDGYDPDLWTKLKWDNEEEIVNSLIKEELTSQYHDKCSSGKWKPAKNSENNTKLLECNLWQSRKNHGESMNSEIRTDPTGFIQGFDLLIRFDDEDNFKKYFRDIKYSLNHISVNPSQELSGIYLNSLVSRSSGVDISSYQCINDPLDCSIKLSLERSGGNEYLRADGGNSMIGENLTFIESKGQSPLKCIRWSNTEENGNGAWSRNTSEDCGIGVYAKTGDAVVVEVSANRGTFKHILLDKSCKNYEWDGTTVVETGTSSPCGIRTDTGEIYQVVSNSISEKIESVDVYAANIFSDSISSNIINALSKLKTDFLESYSGSNIDVYSEMTIKEILNVDEEINLNKINVEDSYCEKNGSISRLNNGGLLSCVSHVWTSTVKDTTPIGAIMLWGSTIIPDGWVEMRGQSTAPYPDLRALIGNTIPDMRGTFVRGWDNGRSLDSGRNLRSYQDEALNGSGLTFVGNPLPAHSHLQYANGSDSDTHPYGGNYISGSRFYNSHGSSGQRTEAVSSGTPTGVIVGSGTETRPVNVALMYIIKAK